MLTSSLFNRYFFFFFNDTATTEIYTLSLHDALPIWFVAARRYGTGRGPRRRPLWVCSPGPGSGGRALGCPQRQQQPAADRSEEHTSELQSRPHLVCRLLLEKKKKTKRKKRQRSPQ